MKTNIAKTIITLGLVLSSILYPLSSSGTLTVTITPGYQFSSVERPTVGTLNMLGTPTATITGSVDGSTGLSAGSVTGTLLADSVVDGVTIQYNGSSPRALAVKPSGIAGGGLRASLTNLFVYVDPYFFALATNSVADTNANTGSIYTNWLTLSRSNGVIPATSIKAATNTIVVGSTNNSGAAIFMGPQFQQQPQTNVSQGVTNIGATFTLSQFTSGLYAITNTVVANVAHGFSNTPVLVRWVLVNMRTDNGYRTNDEVGCDQFGGDFSGGANQTNVFLTRAGAGGGLAIINKSTGVNGTLTETNWLARCYARP